LLFGLTPPRLSTPDVQQVADVTLRRLEPLDLDGLVLYDIADEDARAAGTRPFPYLPTLDPADYLAGHLGAWAGSAVVYRCVGKYSESALRGWLAVQDATRTATVFVGASSREQVVTTSLSRAQALRQELRPDLPLGGVAIPERHKHRRSEHLRLIDKQAQGCGFFVTQVVYDAQAARNLVSDYHYEVRDRGGVEVPLIFTLSVCGSLKTLEFLRWLGVDVPHWMSNALVHSEDLLEASYDQCVATAHDLAGFCTGLGVPFGFNVESVSIRKAEIDAAVRLAAQLRAEFP
ncbi:MAG TPA: 5,10-methylenetetrahydrofolate reductase, partial [Sporichthya sp.]|nr:5,10-methylenetetrahydrofolate reductase [Sporichthya sp.]